MKETGTIKLGIEMPAELRQKVKVAAAQSGIKMKDATVQAFESWLLTVNKDNSQNSTRNGPVLGLQSSESVAEGTQGAPQLTPFERVWIMRILAILRGSSRRKLRALLSIVDAFSEKTVMQEGSTNDQIIENDARNIVIAAGDAIEELTREAHNYAGKFAEAGRSIEALQADLQHRAKRLRAPEKGNSAARKKAG